MVLVHYFAERFARHLNRPLTDFSPQAMYALQEYAWPGNVRELEHWVQRAMLLCDGRRVEVSDVQLAPRKGQPAVESAEIMPLAEWEKQHIQRALEATNWIVDGERGAAKLLGLKPATLRFRMKKHGLQRPR